MLLGDETYTNGMLFFKFRYFKITESDRTQTRKRDVTIVARMKTRA